MRKFRVTRLLPRLFRAIETARTKTQCPAGATFIESAAEPSPCPGGQGRMQGLCFSRLRDAHLSKTCGSIDTRIAKMGQT